MKSGIKPLVEVILILDIAEAETAFISEMEKEFHYIVATQSDKIIGLVTWVPHGHLFDQL